MIIAIEMSRQDAIKLLQDMHTEGDAMGLSDTLVVLRKTYHE